MVLKLGVPVKNHPVWRLLNLSQRPLNSKRIVFFLEFGIVQAVHGALHTETMNFLIGLLSQDFARPLFIVTVYCSKPHPHSTNPIPIQSTVVHYYYFVGIMNSEQTYPTPTASLFCRSRNSVSCHWLDDLHQGNSENLMIAEFWRFI